MQIKKHNGYKSVILRQVVRRYSFKGFKMSPLYYVHQLNVQARHNHFCSWFEQNRTYLNIFFYQNGTTGKLVFNNRHGKATYTPAGMFGFSEDYIKEYYFLPMDEKVPNKKQDQFLKDFQSSRVPLNLIMGRLFELNIYNRDGICVYRATDLKYPDAIQLRTMKVKQFRSQA